MNHLNLEFGDFAVDHIGQSNSKKTTYISIYLKNNLELSLIEKNMSALFSSGETATVQTSVDYDKEYPTRLLITNKKENKMQNNFNIGDCVVKSSLKPFQNGERYGILETKTVNEHHPKKPTNWKIKNCESLMDESMLIKVPDDIVLNEIQLNVTLRIRLRV